MKQHAFFLVAGVLFLLIALAHAVRVAFGVELVVQGISVPTWASAVATVALGYLAYEGFRLARTPQH